MMHPASILLYLGSGIDAMAQSAQTQPVSKLVCIINQQELSWRGQSKRNEQSFNTRLRGNQSAIKQNGFNTTLVPQGQQRGSSWWVRTRYTSKIPDGAFLSKETEVFSTHGVSHIFPHFSPYLLASRLTLGFLPRTKRVGRRLIHWAVRTCLFDPGSMGGWLV